MLESELQRAALFPKLVSWASIANNLRHNAKKTANKRGKHFSLSAKYVGALLADQGYRCAVTGLPFSQYRKQRNPYAPSIDRIDIKRGYEPGNIRLVLYIVNVAMNVWGEDPLIEIAWALTRQSGDTYVSKTGILETKSPAEAGP